MLKSPVALALLCALFWGIAPVLEKAGLRHLPALTGIFVRSLTVAVAVGAAFAVMFIYRREAIAVEALRPSWLLLIAAGGLAGGVAAQYLYYAALKAGEVSTVAPIASAFPLVTVALSVLFLGEAVTAAKLLGATLVVAGVWMLR